MKQSNTTYLQLMFDKETNRIALESCPKEAQGAIYKLREVKDQGQVSGMAFLKHYGIQYANATRAYPAVWENGMLIISL